MVTSPGSIVAGEREMEQVIAGRFRSLGATSPDSAADIVPSDPDEAARFDKMRGQGVILGANGGFYLDEDALGDVRKTRQHWLFGGAGLAAIAGLAAGILIGRRRR